MLTALFAVLFVWLAVKLIRIALKLTWGIAKIGLFLIVLPGVLVSLAFSGLIVIALILAGAVLIGSYVLS